MIEALAGVLCLTTAALLYPAEEGKIQSKLEDFWVRLDDYRDTPFSQAVLLMRMVANYEAHLLNKVFGERLTSNRAVGVSTCLTVTSVSLAVLLIARYQKHIFISSVVYLVVGAFVAVILNCYMSEDNRIRTLVLAILTTFVVLVWAKAQNVIYAGATSDVKALMAALLAIGALCDIAFIMLTRQLVNIVRNATRLYQVAGVVLLNLLIAIIMLGPGVAISSRAYPGANEAILECVAIVSLSNIFDAGLALLFVTFAVLFFLLYAGRPLLSRILFQLVTLDTKNRRSVLLVLGVGLLVSFVSSATFESTLRSLVRVFMG
jgi:hypothetical protein